MKTCLSEVTKLTWVVMGGSEIDSKTKVESLKQPDSCLSLACLCQLLPDACLTSGDLTIIRLFLTTLQSEFRLSTHQPKYL